MGDNLAHAVGKIIDKIEGKNDWTIQDLKDRGYMEVYRYNGPTLNAHRFLKTMLRTTGCDIKTLEDNKGQYVVLGKCPPEHQQALEKVVRGGEE